MYDLLKSQLAVANEEKASLFAQIISLSEKTGIHRLSLERENAFLRETIHGLSVKLELLTDAIHMKMKCVNVS